jgi:hypothetical protein
MNRKSINSDIQASILFSSRRRCPLCFSYEFDASIKNGQIAHIDQDSANNSEDNLVFLCLKHHDEYDSKTSQSKGITAKEIEKCKDELRLFLTAATESIDFKNVKNDTSIDLIKNKLNNHNDFQLVSSEVYNLRIPIYHSYRNYISSIMREGEVQLESYFKFLAETQEAIFLFDEIVQEYLDLIKKNSIDLRKVQRQLEARYNLDVDERNDLIDQEAKLFQVLSKSFDEGDKIFQNYLKIKPS